MSINSFIRKEDKIKAPIILILFVITLGYLWSILGLNYTPVSDGWVNVSVYDRPDAINKMKNIIYGLFSVTENKRWVRNVPFALASRLPGEGFITISSMLFVINVVSGFGLFLVINRLIPGKDFLAALSSLFIVFYPYDGTLFWHGAFGVNLGFALCIYSIFFFICAIEKKSTIHFMLCLLTLFLSGKTYPGYLPLQLLIFFISLLRNRSNYVTWWPKAIAFLVVYLIGFFSFAGNIISGTGRETRVLNLDISKVISGFFYATKHIYFLFANEFFSIDHFNLFGFVSIALAAMSAFYYFEKSNSRQNELYPKNSQNTGYARITLYLLFLGPLILIAGYAPYTISDIRFGTDRQILFARTGVVVFYVSLFLFLVETLVKDKIIASWVRVILPSFIFSLSVQAKGDIAHGFSDVSETERIFLGDMAESVPCSDQQKTMVIYLIDENEKNNVLFWTRNLVARPKFPIGYLYKNYHLNTYVVNSFWLKQFRTAVCGDSLCIGGKKIPMKQLQVLGYSRDYGFQKIKYLPIPNDQVLNSKIEVPNLELDKLSCQISDRQKWFQNERNRLVVKYNLRNPRKSKITGKNLGNLFDAEFKVIDWGPKSTSTGVTPNPQSDGNSGIWIRAELDPGFGSRQVFFDDKPAVTSLNEQIISARIPSELFDKPGVKKISVRQVLTDRNFEVGDFVVLDSK
jgi:hypothetical protein